MIGENSDKVEKTMNTSLHIMEAYANLYRVSGDKIVGDRLRDMIEIFLDKIIDKKTSHLICFLDRSWNSTSTVDSYGHDIESSWLLYEAASLLKDEKLLRRVREAAIKIVNRCFRRLSAGWEHAYGERLFNRTISEPRGRGGSRLKRSGLS